jgi:ubiquinone/menaquinone biosynthesis C-methylase UbiE
MSSIIDTYSELSTDYEQEENLNSCWGQMTNECVGLLEIKDSYKLVLDVGCGPGIQVTTLAEKYPNVQFLGVEPAEGLRESALKKVAKLKNVRFCDGRFESLPVNDASVDYLYSIFAFHWTTNLDESVKELRRVLKPDGAMDLMFIGRQNGAEFIKQTSPIYFKMLHPRALIEATSKRKQLTLQATKKLFESVFDPSTLEVTEMFNTYYDTLERHWKWWCRIEGQFSNLEPQLKHQLDNAVKESLSQLETAQGIPYTIHTIHVKVRI